MIGRLKELLNPRPDGGEGSADLRLAAAALMVEAARLDGVVEHSERARILGLLRERFRMGEAAAEALLREAERAVDKSVQLFGFTRAINDALAVDERVRMIEMLWEVAYADGHLHDFEANLIRRIGGLLFVSDTDTGEARKRVLARQHPAVGQA